MTNDTSSASASDDAPVDASDAAAASGAPPKRTKRPRRDGRSKKRPGVDVQRRIIVEAAIALFVEGGSKGVSVRQICAAADVSRPTFYRCFADRDALVDHLYAATVRDAMELNLAAVLVARATPERVRGELDAMADRIFAQPALAAFLFTESADPNTAAHAIVNQAYDEAATRIERWYAERGWRAPSRVALRATMAACQWAAHDAIRAGLSDEDRDAAKQGMWEIVSGVFWRGRP